MAQLGDSTIVASTSKQKQKIALLQKKLELAERSLGKMQLEVERLGDEMRSSQLALIRSQVDALEEEMDRNPRRVAHLDGSRLFLEEREVLYDMINRGSSNFEAQIVLDRILHMITELGDQSRR
jgi:hypothetical protein